MDERGLEVLSDTDYMPRILEEIKKAKGWV